jgi:hypothetical protein
MRQQQTGFYWQSFIVTEFVIGHSSFVIGHWSLVIGHWSLVIGHLLRGVGDR